MEVAVGVEIKVAVRVTVRRCRNTKRLSRSKMRRSLKSRSDNSINSRRSRGRCNSRRNGRSRRSSILEQQEISQSVGMKVTSEVVTVW